jgi:hypothetical protein
MDAKLDPDIKVKRLLLRRICGPKSGVIVGDWRKFYNEELRKTCNPDQI